MTDTTVASSTDRWWLQDRYRDQFEKDGTEGGQMAPRTWTNRPDEGERFKKFVAGLNPLHHIPGVGMVYRQITGETLEPGQQILGGALFGGVVGLVSGLVNALIKSDTGKDIGENVLAAFDLGDDKPKVAAARTEAPAEVPAAAAAAGAASASPAPVPVPGPQASARTERNGRVTTIEGKLPDVLDLAAIETAAGSNKPQSFAQPAVPAVPAAQAAGAPAAQAAAQAATENRAVSVAAAADDKRWFPARGREYPRGVNLVPPATPPALSTLQNARSEVKPGALPIPARAGAGAYEGALELSRELQRHYLGSQ